MSLSIHLAIQKHSCCRQCIMCERPRYVGLWREGGGDILLFGAGTLDAWREKTVDLRQQRYPEMGCQPWHISQRIVTQL